MKNSLTNRDKRLLLFMFLFVVIVGIGYWGIYPQIKAFVKLESKIDNEEVKKNINEQKVANLVFVESQKEEYEENIAKNKNKFFDMMSEADIDLLLTGKAIKHKLESFNLNIDIAESPSDRKAYRYSELYLQQLEWESYNAVTDSQTSSVEDDIAELSNGTKKKDKKKADEEEEEVVLDETVDIFGNIDRVGVNQDIYAARVTMTLGGDRKDLEAFLQEIMDSEEEILITSFAWSKYRFQKEKDYATNPDNLDGSDNEIIEMDALTITMELYMCDKESIE